MPQAVKLTQRSAGTCFPLHLTPFETFLCADDSPEYPMTSCIRMKFSGVFDRGPFESALEEALVRHPLLAALIRPAKRGIPCWVSAGGLRPTLDWAAEGTPIACPGGDAIDLATECGLRLWVRTGADTSRLYLQLHHACSDGIGVCRFLGDLLALYGMRTAGIGRRPEIEPVDVGRLRLRKRPTVDVADGGSRARMALAAIRGGIPLFFGRCAPLHAPASGLQRASEADPFAQIRSYTFDPAEHQQIRHAGLKLGATVNDLLLAHLFSTVWHWNASHGGLGGNRSVRILMPTDMRGPEEYDIPASNICSYTFLARKGSATVSWEELVRGINRDTVLIKHRRLGTRFVDTVAAVSAVPHLLPRLLRSRRPMATAVLSNTGDPSRRFLAKFPRHRRRAVCGNVVLEEMDGTPPLRRGTRATISIFSYRRMLTVSLRCDPYSFSADDTEELLSQYVAQIGGPVEESSERSAEIRRRKPR